MGMKGCGKFSPHPMKARMIQTLVFLVAVAVLLWFGLRWFERANIYFPDRTITAHPGTFGLPFEDVSLSAKDGVLIHGWWIPAGSSGLTGRPLVPGVTRRVPAARGTLLYLHGNAGNISNRLDRAMAFMAMGFNVFLLEYRGYGNSSGKPTEKGLYLDAEAAYEHLTFERKIDPSGIVLFGESLGGAVAIHLAGRANVGAVVTEGCLTSTVDIGREIFPFLPVSYIVRDRFDALNNLKSVNTPILISHSRRDEIIPFHHAQRLFQAASQPRKLLEIPGGHNDAGLTSDGAALKELEHFLDTHLK